MELMMEGVASIIIATSNYEIGFNLTRSHSAYRLQGQAWYDDINPAIKSEDVFSECFL